MCVLSAGVGNTTQMDTPTHLRTSFRLTALGLVALAGSSLLATPTVRAQDAYHCIDDLSEDEIDYRLSKIQKSFDSGKSHAAGWRFGWMFALSGITGVSAYNLATRQNAKPERFFEYALLGGGLAQIIQLAAIPMPGVYGAKRIRRKPANSIEEKREKLRYATKTLEKSATIQEYFSGPNWGGGGVLYGLVMGSVYVGKYNKDIGAMPKRDARVRARLRAAGMYLLPPALSVGQALSHPTNNYTYWEDYRETACSGKYYDKDDAGPEFDLGMGPTNLTLTVRF